MKFPVMTPVLVLVFFMPGTAALSQTESQLESIIESLAEAGEEEMSPVMEELNDIIENPLLFKDLTEESLGRVPFLSAGQVQSILSYRDSLQGEPSWEDLFILIQAGRLQESILPRIIILNEPESPVFKRKYGIRINGMATGWQNLEEPRGYEGLPPGARPMGTRLRGQVSARDFSIKAIADSDPGETGILSPDHISAGMLIHPFKQGFQIALGDYHAGFGQGLGMATRPSFDSWKADPHLQLRRQRGLSIHGGSDENRFLRGGAIALNYRRLTGSLFVSLKDIDAGIYEGGETGRFFSGIYSSGLHRTGSEKLKKNSLQEEATGIALDYRGNRVEAGGLFMIFGFSEPFRLPDAGSLSRGSVYSSDAQRYSIWFRMLAAGGMMSGEFAGSSTGGKSLVLNYSRFYSRGLAYVISFNRSTALFFSHYTSASGSLILAGGGQGCRINIQYKPLKNWGIQSEAFLEIPTETAAEVYGNEKYHIKTRLFRETRASLFEISFQGKPGNKQLVLKARGLLPESPLSLHGEAGISAKDHAGLIKSPGIYCSLRTAYKSSSGILGLQAGISLFSRSKGSVFYLYEPDILYGMSLPALSGTGTRAFILVKYKVLKQLSLEIKLSRGDYDDRKEIGTGYDLIPFNHRTGVKVQVVYRGGG